MSTEYLKTSFPPISGPHIRVLILGTLPGDASLALNEYYGHPRNRFWSIISKITGSPLPLTYAEKRELLLKADIGVWNVIHKAVRKGSMDHAITREEPNDLEGFIAAHSQLEVIAFNGKKAEQLFDKYFSRKQEIRYISLPATSPANATISFENSCTAWAQILFAASHPH